MKIGEVAKQAGVRVSALRYYEEIGLIAPSHRVSGQRHYDESVLVSLAFIKVAQSAGFNLQEIHALLHGFEEDTPASQRWRVFAQQKIAEIDGLIKQYEAMKQVLREGMACGCVDLSTCEILAMA